MASASRSFFARGKLLLTSEYVVLDGIPAVAVPTHLGQRLEVTEVLDIPILNWTARAHDSRIWLEGTLERTPEGWRPSSHGAHPAAGLDGLAVLMTAAERLRGTPLPGGSAETFLEFPNDYGWGSSSTLISLVAQWAEVDALALHFATQNGSGYDAVCALVSGPIRYTRTGPTSAEWVSVSLAHWPRNTLYLVHLGEKQRSAEDVVRYRSLEPSTLLLDAVGAAAERLFHAATPEEWSEAARAHEAAMGQILGRTPVAETRFANYPHAVKSLGAWGGDFVLAQVREASDLLWFKERGFSTVLPWSDCVVLG
jgi:mevalonate kinase